MKFKDWGNKKPTTIKKINEILHHQGLLFVSKAIWIELISRYYNNPLAGHFGIKKICKLLAQKYYWPTFRYNVEAYIKDCDICLALKTVCHKPCNDFHSFFVPMHWWKNLLIDFVTYLSISINWKKDGYDAILVIVDWHTKMVYYKPVKMTINTLKLAGVRINVVVYYYSLPDSIVTNTSSFFTSKFWSLPYYILGIKRRLSTIFYL